jgi:5-(carboxyamino)imidazole ribonucleotide mutase
VQMLASHDPALFKQVQDYRASLKEMVLGKQAQLETLGIEAYLQQI